MKFKLEELKLSGKGFVASSEWLDDNLKIVTTGVNFHEVVVEKDEETKFVGWIVDGSIQVLADLTAHTKKGMRGRSVNDTVEFPFIMDFDNKLSDMVSDLTDMPTENTEKILEKYKTDKGGKFNWEGDANVNIDDKNEGLIIISTKTEYIFVQNEKSSIRVSGKGEVLVLNKKEGEDNLVEVSKRDGVVVIGGDKSIEVGKNGIVIDGEEFNPEKIVNKAMKEVSKAFSDMFR